MKLSLINETPKKKTKVASKEKQDELQDLLAAEKEKEEKDKHGFDRETFKKEMGDFLKSL